MNAGLERELKLEAPASFSLARLDPEIDSFTVEPAEHRRLHTIYYDTTDLRLVRWGASLRYRVGEGWTLKLPQPGKGKASYRTEHVFPGDASALPAAALDLAAAMLRGRTPQPLIELRTIRTRRAVRSPENGSELAEIVEDDVRVVRSSAVVDRFRQIEIELSEGAPAKVLGRLSRCLRRQGAGRPDAVPKIILAVGKRADEPEVPVPKLDARTRAGELARAALAADVDRLVPIDSHLRLEPNRDTVHDARVAVRRLRSHLRTFEWVFDPAWARVLRERMRWLSDGLATARDADVLLDHVAEQAARLPSVDRRRADDALEPLRERRSAAYDGLSRLLHDPRYLPLIDALIEAAKDPPLSAAARRPARTMVDDLMRAVWRRLRKRVRRAGRTPSDRDLHRIRIKTKQLRYAAEAVAPVAGRRATRFARHVEELQSQLGELHDAVNACRALHEHLETPERAFLAGQLAAFEQAVAACWRQRWRGTWKRVAKRKFWSSRA
jgi:CHAD domain-containing protein